MFRYKSPIRTSFQQILDRRILFGLMVDLWCPGSRRGAAYPDLRSMSPGRYSPLVTRRAVPSTVPAPRPRSAPWIAAHATRREWLRFSSNNSRPLPAKQEGQPGYIHREVQRIAFNNPGNTRGDNPADTFVPLHEASQNVTLYHGAHGRPSPAHCWRWNPTRVRCNHSRSCQQNMTTTRPRQGNFRGGQHAARARQSVVCGGTPCNGRYNRCQRRRCGIEPAQSAAGCGLSLHGVSVVLFFSVEDGNPTEGVERSP